MVAGGQATVRARVALVVMDSVHTTPIPCRCDTPERDYTMVTYGKTASDAAEAVRT